ncbi:MAG: Endonuclease/Exonuclease/phosphatase family [Candidatus Doudnabacteria bacterium]|nr:Endonuclease/Exonuclease/phosphatase family [Candidatus Doudnabacteria bacterium]
MGWKQRADLATEVFGNMPVGLVGFQEFGRKDPENPEQRNSWNSLHRGHPEMDVYYGEEAGDIFINPIAFDPVRFELIERGTFWLSDDGSYKKGWDGVVEHGASWVLVLDRAMRRTFLHINAHLDNKGIVARAEGVRLILQFAEGNFRSNRPLPTIITADSNVSVGSPQGTLGSPHQRWADPEKRSWGDPDMRRPYDMMVKAGFTDTWIAAHPYDPNQGRVLGQLTSLRRPMTYHGFQGVDYRGDGWGTWDTEWIFVRGFKVLNSVLVKDNKGGIYPSDHYPMMALLDYESE